MMIKRSVLTAALVLCAISIIAHASDSDLTPLPGDPLRKQVLDALRTEVKRIHGLEVVFVVKHIKVKDGWAWVDTMPQSPDGKNKYEGISALLQLKDGDWDVIEIPCAEVDNPECIDGSGYFDQLRIRHPEVSVELFPDTEIKPGGI